MTSVDENEFTFGPNPLRLSLSQWAWTFLICLTVLILAAPVWSWLEHYETDTDYRVPYLLSDDYWVFERWSARSVAEYPVLILGDSVVWGQYVARRQTLSHHLNQQAGPPARFANLGIDGIHPLAMWGLVKYYGKTIQHKPVVLHFNPLWMTSRQHDLQGEEEFRFNHPRLVPQVYPDLACYNPSLNEIVAIVAERHVSFFTLVNHLKTVSFERMNLQGWTVMYPYRNPVTAVPLSVPAPGEEAREQEVSWKKRRIRVQDFPWVSPDESQQWNACIRLIRLLQSRQNRVFVLLGPFNPYVLSDASKARYATVKQEMEGWLTSERVAHFSMPDLPSEEYADASHPLRTGYAGMAAAIWANPSFQDWMNQEVPGRETGKP